MIKDVLYDGEKVPKRPFRSGLQGDIDSFYLFSVEITGG